MRIGELARRAGVNTSTIRYYEREGFLAEPDRTGANYRDYGPADLRRVRFLKRAQELGFTLVEVQLLLGFSSGAALPRAEIERVGKLKLGEIQQRIDDLVRVRDALAGLLSRDCLDPKESCPIVEALVPSDRERA